MKFSTTATCVALSSALILAACGGGAVDADADGDGEVTAEEAQAAAAQVSDEVKPQAGKYRATMNFVNAELPGAPPEMVEMMGSAMQNQETEFCLTQEEAEKGFGEAMRESQDDSCSISQLTLNGGSMDMAMTCTEEGMGEVNIALTGTVTPTSSDLTMVTEGTFGPMGEGKVEMNVKQERIGDCEGEE